MIELKVTGKCLGCPALKIANIQYFVEGERPAETMIRCANQRICDHLEKRLREMHGEAAR